MRAQLALALALLATLALGATPPAYGEPAAPPDPLAARAKWALTVSQEGMHMLSGAALAAAGLDLDTLDPARLQLWRRGQPVPIAEIGTRDGRLDPGDSLRFYAPPPGDRWSAADSYWLSVEPGPGARMERRAAPQPAPPACAGAEERGTLGRPTVYASRLPGADGDHWFLAALRAGGEPDAWESGPMKTNLPVTRGTLRLTVSGSATGPGPHHLFLQVGEARAARRWEGNGDWSFELRVEGGDAELTVRLAAGPDEADTLLLDRVEWALPVALRSAGRPAAVTILGPGLCRLEEAHLAAALYEISDPLAPLRVALGPEGLIAPGVYRIVGPEDLHTAPVRRRERADLSRIARADLIYIAPADLHAALAPLVELRRSQGHTVAVIDSRQIYDAWGGGAMSPEAIRAMLRWAWATWQPPPRAVTLVGDGSADPRDYSGLGAPNLIPPFLAMVDPYLGETACENCFAQLDGANPLDDRRPDLLIGRLPVKSAAELEVVVAKIIGYETAAGGLEWRSRAILLADNGREADGRPDPAGDFAAVAEGLRAAMPPGVAVERLYYDPLAPPEEPWRERDAIRANARTLAALRSGAGLVVYIGHAHYWQWASTDPGGPRPALLELLDVDTLTNGGRLPVVLSMTCLSSAFQQPSYDGTTIDELLLLHPDGGAVAVWGSTGLSVLTGHQSLIRGFNTALWQGGGTTPVGVLARAGYNELLREGCCDKSIWTFVILGDPLTPARAVPAHRIWTPLLMLRMKDEG